MLLWAMFSFVMAYFLNDQEFMEHLLFTMLGVENIKTR